MKKFLALALVFATVGCSDPHDIKITAENKDQVIKQVAEARGLSDEEKKLFVGYTMRVALGNAFVGAFSGRSPDPNAILSGLEGKTVGEVIEVERKFEAEEAIRKEQEAKKKAEEDRLAAEAKAKDEAQLAEMRKAIQVTVYEKHAFRNGEGGYYGDTNEFKFVAKNSGAKAVKAFDGQITVSDVLGTRILTHDVQKIEVVKAGAQIRWKAGFYAFGDDSAKLGNSSLSDLKVEWSPKQVVFTDGTKLVRSGNL